MLGTTVLASGPAGPHHRTIRTHAVPWTSAKPYAHGRKLRVTWWSGVAPCSVFDHITVKQTARRVVVTVYEGAAPSSPNTVCLAIAVKKTRTVKLRTPLGSRKVVDGAPRPRSH
ncbi:hypothetical protein [Microbispora sp. NPDC049125]|uniref:hypothetical protein n=1 Tax=Microbispora sp. NPDC049125 TaxID=3154929 RepID=UPI003465ED54